eukprot:TRINITY_DN7825_c0_g1_i1.p1 TRINITY_DN7825_c0_g1~~TRINITY_DN7825_c0_g1_i1.p1  ORF type:complete len:704 (+),score=102.66 TRINITY_DN7825_c0_g1_i1:92-2113(+)
MSSTSSSEALGAVSSLNGDAADFTIDARQLVLSSARPLAGSSTCYEPLPEDEEACVPLRISSCSGSLAFSATQSSLWSWNVERKASKTSVSSSIRRMSRSTRALSELSWARTSSEQFTAVNSARASMAALGGSPRATEQLELSGVQSVFAGASSSTTAPPLDSQPGFVSESCGRRSASALVGTVEIDAEELGGALASSATTPPPAIGGTARSGESITTLKMEAAAEAGALPLRRASRKRRRRGSRSDVGVSGISSATLEPICERGDIRLGRACAAGGVAGINDGVTSRCTTAAEASYNANVNDASTPGIAVSGIDGAVDVGSVEVAEVAGPRASSAAGTSSAGGSRRRRVRNESTIDPRTGGAAKRDDIQRMLNIYGGACTGPSTGPSGTGNGVAASALTPQTANAEGPKSPRSRRGGGAADLTGKGNVATEVDAAASNVGGAERAVEATVAVDVDRPRDGNVTVASHCRGASKCADSNGDASQTATCAIAVESPCSQREGCGEACALAAGVRSLGSDAACVAVSGEDAAAVSSDSAAGNAATGSGAGALVSSGGAGQLAWEERVLHGLPRATRSPDAGRAAAKLLAGMLVSGGIGGANAGGENAPVVLAPRFRERTALPQAPASLQRKRVRNPATPASGGLAAGGPVRAGSAYQALSGVYCCEVQSCGSQRS